MGVKRRGPLPRLALRRRDEHHRLVVPDLHLALAVELGRLDRPAGLASVPAGAAGGVARAKAAAVVWKGKIEIQERG